MPIWNCRTFLFLAIATVGLLIGGCKSTSTPDWDDPESVEIIASAISIGPEDSDLLPLLQALLKGDTSEAKHYRLKPFKNPFYLTAYAAPILEARRSQTPRFRTPIRALPADHTPGKPLPSRSELANSLNKNTRAIGWVANPLDAYLAEVNGSVKLLFPDGETACLSWIATNELPYTSLGRLLVERGHVDREKINLDAIQRMHEKQPKLVEELMLENQRAVFFEEIPCDAWPRASTGAVLQTDHSVAVDPEVIPLGSVLVIETIHELGKSHRQLVAAVDTGGAIRGERIDLYFGAGAEALKRAGALAQPASVYILVPRSGSEQPNSQGTGKQKQP